MNALLATDLPLYAFLTLLAIAWGACIGSFLNVCICRIPEELSVITPASRCPACKTPIRWFQNIPVFSFLFLRGKCAACGVRIPPRYAVVELLTALLFLLAWLKFDSGGGPRPFGLVPASDILLVPVFWLVVSGLVLGTFVDFDHMIIPDRVTWGGMICGLLASAAVPALHGETAVLPSLLKSVIGAAAGFGLLWSVAMLGEFVFKKEAMGFGDVKLMGAIGAFFGWRAVLFTVMASSFAGTLVGITLIANRRKELQSRIPYGPYLALAALLWMLWGDAWWDAYLRFVMPPAP